MATTWARIRDCVTESDTTPISQYMESRNGDQDRWPDIGSPQWYPYAMPRPLQAPIEYGQGRSTEPRFTPDFYTALGGHPSFQHPIHEPLRTMTGGVTEMPHIPASYPETSTESVHGLEPTAILDRDTFFTCPPVGSRPFRSMIQDSRIGDTFDRSIETWTWQQGYPHEQQTYSFGSDGFRNSDNGSNRQLDDLYTTPPGPLWTDHPLPRTPSPGSGNHDSPGLPGTPYHERMRDYAAAEDPLPRGISNWGLHVPFVSRNGQIQATQQTESSTQRYYSDGQSSLMKLGGIRPLSWSWKEKKLENLVSRCRSYRRIADKERTV